MRRLGRWMFNAAVAISLVLCVATVVLWVRSYWRVDGVIYQPIIGDDARHLCQVSWGRGILTARIEAAEPSARSRLFWWSSVPSGNGAFGTDPDEVFHLLGVSVVRRMESVSLRSAAARPALWVSAASRPATAPAVYAASRPTKLLWVHEVYVSVPCWLAAAISACLPATWLHSRRRRLIVQGRLERGECAHCGYDLRASPDRCPECGTMAEGKAEARSQMSEVSEIKKAE